MRYSALKLNNLFVLHFEKKKNRMDWLDLRAVQGTLKSLLQHHSSKASILQASTFFTEDLFTCSLF